MLNSAYLFATNLNLGSRSMTKKLAKVSDGKCRSGTMKHCMAVEADGAQISNQINAVLAPYLGEHKQVTHVNITLSKLAISIAKKSKS
jgi:hypothetical protein